MAVSNTMPCYCLLAICVVCGPSDHSICQAMPIFYTWNSYREQLDDTKLNFNCFFCCWTGDHTRSIMVSTPSLAAGGIMKFAKVRYSCLGCKATLAPGDTTLCKHCRNKVSSTDFTCIVEPHFQISILVLLIASLGLHVQLQCDVCRRQRYTRRRLWVSTS